MEHTIICGSIVCQGNSVLLVQERKERAYGEWNLPTGKIEVGESLEECAVREAMEEAGVSVEPRELVGVYSKPSDKSDVVLAVIFHCEAAGFELNPDFDEVLDAEWVSLDEVDERELRSSHILPAIRDYQSGDLVSLDILSSLDEA